MPVRQLRRIGPRVGEGLYDQLRARLLHDTLFRGETDALARDHPGLILRRGDNILVAAPHADAARLLYGFESVAAFVEEFPAMLETMLPLVRRELRADGVRLRLSYSPARTSVEPVLKRLWFQPRRDWLQFSLERGGRLPAAPAARVKFRDGSAADAEELARIDREAFPDTPLGVEAMSGLIERGGAPLLAIAGGEIAGCCLYAQPDPGEGYIFVLAVSERYRRMGTGAALTVRAARRLFSEGAQRVGLTTDESNGAAIRLYVSLGFRQTLAGRDYTRPTSDKAIERMKSEGTGTLIRFGGWR
jgi:ribosomal protein S18 acetylase RimI-like enzyme